MLSTKKDTVCQCHILHHCTAKLFAVQMLFEALEWVKVYYELAKCTGKSFSEALSFVTTNPQYDKRLFIELQVQYIKIPSSEHVVFFDLFWHSVQFMYTTCSQHVLSLEFSCTELVIQWTTCMTNCSKVLIYLSFLLFPKDLLL